MRNIIEVNLTFVVLGNRPTMRINTLRIPSHTARDKLFIVQWRIQTFHRGEGVRNMKFDYHILYRPRKRGGGGMASLRPSPDISTTVSFVKASGHGSLGPGAQPPNPDVQFCGPNFPCQCDTGCTKSAKSCLGHTLRETLDPPHPPRSTTVIFHVFILFAH